MGDFFSQILNLNWLFFKLNQFIYDNTNLSY